MAKITLKSVNDSILSLKDDINNTILDLRNEMLKGFEELAKMVKRGFDETATKKEFADVQTGLNSRIDNLERGQDDILLKMDNFAYKFEVNELKKRATKTEGRLNRLEEAKK